MPLIGWFWEISEIYLGHKMQTVKLYVTCPLKIILMNILYASLDNVWKWHYNQIT